MSMAVLVDAYGVLGKRVRAGWWWWCPARRGGKAAELKTSTASYLNSRGACRRKRRGSTWDESREGNTRPGRLKRLICALTGRPPRPRVLPVSLRNYKPAPTYGSARAASGDAPITVHCLAAAPPQRVIGALAPSALKELPIFWTLHSAPFHLFQIRAAPPLAVYWKSCDFYEGVGFVAEVVELVCVYPPDCGTGHSISGVGPGPRSSIELRTVYHLSCAYEGRGVRRSVASGKDS
ncbi:hypothetical protein PENSPDRAFT_255831 [Peniophora sp. CONT]|nr:hypothetical protein PENSPDRAFT_255831 [Peniophora sp. CONT]